MSRKPEHAAQSAFTYDRHAQALADIFIRGLEEGTAPWVKPWRDGDPTLTSPYNPTTGKAYRGGNAVALMCAEVGMQNAGSLPSPDSRWMTFKQALSVGAQVRRGQKGVQLLKWLETTDKDSPKGQPVDGATADKDNKRLIALPFWVFHASQIDGLPPAPTQEPKPVADRLKQVDDLVRESGAVVRHGGDRAFYSPAQDFIQMPPDDQFRDMPAYAATLLHELGHWTGHETRLNRTFSFDRRGEGYAREELRAEMSSLAMAQRLAVPHDPSQHFAYVASWIKLLRDDPRELLRAASDVEKILAHLNVPERQHEILPQIERVQERAAAQDKAREGHVATTAMADPATLAPARARRERPRTRSVDLSR